MTKDKLSAQDLDSQKQSLNILNKKIREGGSKRKIEEEIIENEDDEVDTFKVLQKSQDHTSSQEVEQDALNTLNNKKQQIFYETNYTVPASNKNQNLSFIGPLNDMLYYRVFDKYFRLSVLQILGIVLPCIVFSLGLYMYNKRYILTNAKGDIIVYSIREDGIVFGFNLVFLKMEIDNVKDKRYGSKCDSDENCFDINSKVNAENI